MNRPDAGEPASEGMPFDDEAIRATIYRSCLLLDEERFDDYIALFAPGARYRITTWSPDIRRELVLLDHDREGYATMLSNVHFHVRMPGTLSRHLTGQLIEREDDALARATTSLLVMHTALDGVSRVFGVGKYLDTFDLRGARPLIAEREVRMETREFGAGSHVPM